jgi:glycosyltransferase involved in cell wall biosynthesis
VSGAAPNTAKSTDSSRLVILAHYGGSYAGTFVSMVRAIVREARMRGWQAEVVLSAVAKQRQWLDDLESDGIPYRFAPEISPIALGGWLADNVVGKSGQTILHTHFTRFDVPAALVSRLRSNVSVFWHIHSYALPQLNIRVRNFLKYALAGRLVKRIFCVAPDIAQAVRKRGGDSNRVVYTPNAIDTSHFPMATEEERLRARQELGLPRDQRVVLHFGWDWERKGGDVFVSTIEQLTIAGVPILGVTVGAGDLARAAVAERGVMSIRVLEARNDVRTLYAAADVFFAPSVAEGMPFALVEALSSGLPAVASDSPGHAVIAQGIDACRLTARSAVAFAAAVRATLGRDSDATASEAQAARLQVVQRFDLRAWAKRMVDCYERD